MIQTFEYSFVNKPDYDGVNSFTLPYMKKVPVAVFL